MAKVAPLTQPGGAPDFAAAAAILGVTEHELMDALGGPPPDYGCRGSDIEHS